MAKPSFVYVIYIATTAEKVWRALIEGEMVRMYWGGPSGDSAPRENLSSWTAGAPWESRRQDARRTLDIAGTVLEATEPRRLVLTWARPEDATNAGKHSRVTFDIERHGSELVRLTVTHENLERDQEMLAGISDGWPKVLSNLKTLLETGRVSANAPWSA